MREIGKTKLANVLVAAGCVAIAAIALHLHDVRGEDARTVPPPTESLRIEKTELPSSSADEHETTACAPTGVVVLTCRLDEVELTSGFYKN